MVHKKWLIAYLYTFFCNGAMLFAIHPEAPKPESLALRKISEVVKDSVEALKTLEPKKREEEMRNLRTRLEQVEQERANLLRDKSEVDYLKIYQGNIDEAIMGVEYAIKSFITRKQPPEFIQPKVTQLKLLKKLKETTDVIEGIEKWSAKLKERYEPRKRREYVALPEKELVVEEKPYMPWPTGDIPQARARLKALEGKYKKEISNYEASETYKWLKQADETALDTMIRDQVSSPPQRLTELQELRDLRKIFAIQKPKTAREAQDMADKYFKKVEPFQSEVPEIMKNLANAQQPVTEKAVLKTLLLQKRNELQDPKLTETQISDLQKDINSLQQALRMLDLMQDAQRTIRFGRPYQRVYFVQKSLTGQHLVSIQEPQNLPEAIKLAVQYAAQVEKSKDIIPKVYQALVNDPQFEGRALFYSELDILNYAKNKEIQGINDDQHKILDQLRAARKKLHEVFHGKPPEGDKPGMPAPFWGQAPEIQEALAPSEEVFIKAKVNVALQQQGQGYVNPIPVTGQAVAYALATKHGIEVKNNIINIATLNQYEKDLLQTIAPKRGAKLLTEYKDLLELLQKLAEIKGLKYYVIKRQVKAIKPALLTPERTAQLLEQYKNKDIDEEIARLENELIKIRTQSTMISPEQELEQNLKNLKAVKQRYQTLRKTREQYKQKIDLYGYALGESLEVWKKTLADMKEAAKPSEIQVPTFEGVLGQSIKRLEEMIKLREEIENTAKEFEQLELYFKKGSE